MTDPFEASDGNGVWTAARWPGHEITQALQGLISGTGMWRNDALVGIERAGRYLAGGSGPDHVAEAPPPAGDGSWTRFIGRIAAVALRAAAPSTRPERREVLLNLLEVWARSPFPDPAYRFRTGQVTGAEGWGVRGASGAVLVTYWPKHGTGPFLEARRDGAEPPVAGTIGAPLDVPQGWGTRAQLCRLIELVRQRGPVPWDRGAVEQLAQATGMSTGAAALVLAGNPGAGSHSVPFLDAGERRVLGLTSAEAEDARQELDSLDALDRLQLLSAALPEELSELWEPGGLRRVADRTAQEWTTHRPAGRAAPRATWEAALGLRTGLSATRLCGLFLEPDARVFPVWADERAASHRSVPLPLRSAYEDAVRGENRTGRGAWRALVQALPWAYADLPAGDPVRGGAPEAVRLLRGVLEPLRDASGRIPADDLWRHGLSARQAEWLRGHVCARAMARIADGSLAEGRYESDPRACVPELVERVARHLGVDEAPAAYYLQVLALEAPTDRRVRRWMSWSPRELRAARAVLVGRGLLVEDKRPRAGRTAFLPGPWAHAAAPLPPMERWKAPLLGAALSADGDTVQDVPLPAHTLPDLFALAWRRMTAGQAPAG
ncbi:hypothetical protein [Streptomyces sp. NPDC007083]|uniref:hypothetical protein n=1 Tax=unclassified Streptomyces TaxID=2593676 RepID=UPI0033F2030B